MMCKWCGIERQANDFYTHPGMSSGRLNKCRFCQMENSRLNYRKNRAQRMDYDKKRNHTLERKAAKAVYLRTTRAKFPQKSRARRILNYHVQEGNLIRKPCSICGDPKTEAHHRDYSKPLQVEWLCRYHHRLVEGRAAV